MNKITTIKLLTALLVFIISIAVFVLNKNLRVPSIFDGKFYTTKSIPISTQPTSLEKKYIINPDLVTWTDSLTAVRYGYTDLFLKNTNTTSFLVIKDDKIIFERYLNGVKEGDITQVFSVTKVFMTGLLGIALKEGIIRNVNEKISQYFPELKDTLYNQLTFEHLYQMTSGLNYDEYGKLLQTIGFYYENNLSNAINKAKFQYQPGKVYKYKSIDTQILGESMARALHEKDIIDYFYEKIWDKLGMEDKGYFTLDSKLTRIPKYYGGLNMSARDLAKYGIMVMNNGKYKNKQIVPSYWFNQCNDTSYRSEEEEKYCLGWYYSVDDDNSDVFYAAGFNGQIMLINKTRKVIVIRLGIDRGGVSWYQQLKKLSEIV